jgi:hypothetical protein
MIPQFTTGRQRNSREYLTTETQRRRREEER